MSDKLSLQDLLEVQKHFGLPSPALGEKDWYVVKAIAAIAAIDTSPFQLVGLCDRYRYNFSFGKMHYNRETSNGIIDGSKIAHILTRVERE